MGSKKLFFVVALLCASAFGQNNLVPVPPIFVGPGTTPRLGANLTITFCTSAATGAPCSPLAQAYSDSTNSFPINQTSTPLKTDALGNAPTFYAAPGQYSYTVSGPAISTPQGPFQITVPCIPGSTCVALGISNTGNLSITGNGSIGGTLGVTGALSAPSGTFSGAVTAGSLNSGTINNTCMADQQTGADMGAKIVTCHGTLPATGGIIDATGLQGNQVFSTDWANSITKPVTILLGNVTLKGNSAIGLTFSANNVTVVGFGDGTAGTGSTIASQGTMTNFIHVTGQNVNFRNFRVDTSASGCNVTNSIFDDVSGSSFNMQGVYELNAANTDVGNCGNVNIQGNLYYIQGNTFDSQSIGISTIGAIDGQILQNVFVNFRTGIYNQTTSNNTVISGNVFQNVLGSGVVAGLDAFLLEGSGHITINGNVIKQSREHGFYVASKGAGSVPNTQINITGNNVFNLPGSGIKVHATNGTFPDQQITIAGNTVQCADPTVAIPTNSGGLQVDQSAGVSVSGNTARRCQIGIDVEGQTNGLVISGNVIEYNNAAGILLRDAVGPLRNIAITGNSINNNNLSLGGFGAVHILPDNGGVGGGTNVDTNILIANNSINDYQLTFPSQTTTAANVTSNVATLTMTNNPIGTGFQVGVQAVVAGFTGADTIFNGTFALTAVTSTSISYALVHANQTAATNGSVTMNTTTSLGIAAISPTNGSAINTVRLIDNSISASIFNLGQFYGLNPGYTTSYLRHNGTNTPNGGFLNGWVGSEYNRIDGPPYKYIKISGDGTSSGWGIAAPYTLTLTAQYTNSTTGFTTVGTPNLSFAADANQTITATCHLYYQAASTGGLNIQFTGPSAPTAVSYGLNEPTGAAAMNMQAATAFGTSLGAAVATATTNFDAVVSFDLVNGANAGTVVLQAKSSAAAQLQIQTGSYCTIQ